MLIVIPQKEGAATVKDIAILLKAAFKGIVCERTNELPAPFHTFRESSMEIMKGDIARFQRYLWSHLDSNDQTFESWSG